MGPLFVAGLALLATAHGRVTRRAAGVALVALEFAWPGYRRFKLRPGVPRLLAYNRKDEGAGSSASADG